MTDMIDRIKALRAKVPENGATEDEAMAALALAEKLMKKHGLSEADLKNIEFARDMRQGQFTQKQKAVHPSQKFCGVKISQFCGIKLWTSWVTPKKKHVKMFGLNNDVEMAEFLMALVHNSMDRGWKEFLATNLPTSESRHTQYWSFMAGFAERINEKLDELMSSRTTQEDSTGNDLVEVKMAIVEEGLSAMLPSLKLRNGQGRGHALNMGAYGQGQAAGDKVNLSRPIRKASGAKQLQ